MIRVGSPDVCISTQEMEVDTRPSRLNTILQRFVVDVCAGLSGIDVNIDSFKSSQALIFGNTSSSID
jgi:hypothetical protein